MRREHVEYLKDLPINIRLGNIIEYPIHWKESIEILFVLKGKIKVGIETETNIVEEREIEIINPNEVYWVKSLAEENLVLIVNIDPNFFERYYDDAKEIFFYTDSSKNNDQEDEKYYILRRYLAILVFEAVSQIDDYEDKLEENLLEMMYHLLNEFHYLFYEGENLEEDEIQLERYHRIIKYLSNNYMDKVSLQDIADKEFLSSQYLSYKIKDTFGLGFNEYLNQIRVEESTKLLLDTNRSITDISEEVGFSHVRYYNKHFKIHYNMTALQYRKKYKVSKKQLENMKKLVYFDIDESIPHLASYIEDYERFNFDNNIIKLDIDLSSKSIEDFHGPSILDLGEAVLLLEEENRRTLEEIQSEIKFEYAILNNLFSEDMDIYRGKNRGFINWTRVENILDFILEVKLKPIINTWGVEEYILDDFLSSFSYIYHKDIRQWLVKDLSKISSGFLRKDIDPVHDKINMVPYIIHSYTVLKKPIILKMIDEISQDTELNNDSFFGGNGIYTNNYLNKPSYYAYMLLSLLGEEVISKGDGYLVTRSESGYQVLLYDSGDVDEDIIYIKQEEKPKESKYSINFYNMQGDFQITKYDLNRAYGSSYDKWQNLGSPYRMDNWHWELLKKYVHPDISYSYGKKSVVFNALNTVKSNGAILLILNHVQNE